MKADQPKTPGAMVLISRDLLERACFRVSGNSISENHSAIVDRGRAQADIRQILAIHAEQTPAVGGELLQDLSHDLVIETERAIRQRDAYLQTGVSTAGHGGSHDTCFPAILRKHVGPLLARIAELEAQIAEANDWSHLKPDMDPPK